MMSRILQRCCVVLVICSLVWMADGASAQDVSPWQRPESSKALLESLGLKLDEIEDRKKQSEEYLELYLRVLMRMQQLPRGLVHEWAKETPGLTQIESDPAKYRGDLVRLTGDLHFVECVKAPKELADRFDSISLYRLRIGLQNQGSIDVWTKIIPAHLNTFFEKGGVGLGGGVAGIGATSRSSQPIPVSTEAIFLLIGKQETPPAKGKSPERITFVADRLSWLPTCESADLGATRSMGALGKAGFDVGLLDAVREESAKRLTAEVTEPFLQILAVQDRVDWASLEAKPLQLGKLVSQPKEFVGEAIEIDAVARRVVEIAIEKEGDRKRLGIERYYEIDVVIPKPIRTIVKDRDGKEREVEQSNFPMTICATEAPEGIAIGADIRESIRAKAFFFKLWAYESKFAQEQSIDAMQVSPLFVTARVERAPAAEVNSRSLLWVIGGAVGILGLIAVWGYLLIRGDDLQEKQRKAAKHQVIEPSTIPGPTGDSIVRD